MASSFEQSATGHLSWSGSRGPTRRSLWISGNQMRRQKSDQLSHRVLFIQAANPGAYPPLIHASTLMAEAGWEGNCSVRSNRQQRATSSGSASAHQSQHDLDPLVTSDEQYWLRALCSGHRMTGTATLGEHCLRFRSSRSRTWTVRCATLRCRTGLPRARRSVPRDAAPCPGTITRGSGSRGAASSAGRDAGPPPTGGRPVRWDANVESN
jgi:hypothetical protein